jgi:hypothetical protein
MCASACVCVCVRLPVCVCVCVCVGRYVLWDRGDRDLFSEKEGNGFGRLQLDQYISQLEFY